MELKSLRLKRNEERRLQAGHLWIFSNEVNTKITPLKDFYAGEQVRVESHNGKLLGNAYVNPRSLICARIFSRDSRLLDHKLLMERISLAYSLRQRLFEKPFYRLVYGESDLLPGLVVDRFGSHLSVQLNSAGMEGVKDIIVDVLRTLLHPESILFRNDGPMRLLEGLEQCVESGFGNPPDEVELVENDVKMLAPLMGGQKTGWFYDQRPNRAKLQEYVKGKRVLDVFSYVGSFGVQAAVAGAREVWAVDASSLALEMAEKNSRLNGVENRFSTLKGDGFDVLKSLIEDGEKFDVIVVDPPAFIKRKKDHKQGLRGYQRINELALRLTVDDAILLSASCSMHLQQFELMDILRSGGLRTNRHLQILFEGMQGPDHPVHPAIPETRYLKALLARVTKQ
ncbi:MAG: class I SAM-dependent rRNA methyltransferase [Desulforhopalus sp.]